MMTRINFGLHVSEGWQSPFETVAKCVSYNFLCAKRHFEHVFSNEPEIFHNGRWITTSSENVQGKQWHFVIGCIELIPVIGHLEEQRIQQEKESKELAIERARESAKLEQVNVKLEEQKKELKQRLIDQFGPEKPQEI